MHTLYGAIRVERLSPPVASRLAAYASAALYSGLAVTDASLPPLRGRLNQFPPLSLPGTGDRGRADRQIDGPLAAIAAERVVLDSLLREALPTTRAAIGRLADSLAHARAAQGIAGATAARSSELGHRLGLSIIAWAHADGFDSTRGRAYSPPSGLGYWVNDAPANTFATQSLSRASELVTLDNPANVLRGGNSSDRSLILSRPKPGSAKTVPAVNMAGTSEPYWGELRPFVLARWDECPVPPPPPYSTDRSSPLYQNADDVRTIRSRMTPEQRTIAFYWADNAGESGTPVGHWLAIASEMVSERHLAIGDAARLMTMVSAAQADAFISSWGYKYRYALIRPRTYIRRVQDPNWEPLIPTPPFPEYPSGHSTVSAAAAAVLTATVGNVAFEDSTGLSIGSAIRRFDSFRAAAAEAGLSRIYGGIHFPYGNLGGRALGECIGERVASRFAR